MKRNTVLCLATMGLLAGCGDQTMVAGLFLNTPAITINNPGNTPGVDAGPVTVGPYSVLIGFVVSINTSDITNISAADIAPVSGVLATLNFESCLALPDGGAVVDAGNCIASGHGGTDRILPIPAAGQAADAGFTTSDGGTGSGRDGGSQDVTGGLYELLSTDNHDLTFETGVTYAMILRVPDGDSFGARFKPGPPAHMVEFANKSNPLVRSAADTSPLIITRDDAKVDGQYLPAALLIGRIDPNSLSSVPEIVFKTFDYSDPKTLALFVLSDQPYRVDHFTVDPSVFSASGYYVVTMISISEGPASANAFIGSVALSGSGDSGLVIVK
jgi:hypothetical protein